MSGFKRLFWALTLLWALFCLVVYPLHEQWTKQQEAFAQYNKHNKFCDELISERPESPLANGCYKRSDDDLQFALQLYSFKHFWFLPVAGWPFFLPLIAIPPAVVYGLAALGMWVRNGFRTRTHHP
jgi:hypothetical protein